MSALCATGRLEEGGAVFQRLVELHRGASGIRGFWAEILMQEGRFDEAAAIAAQEPENYVRRTGIALIAWARKKRPQADAALQELVAQDAGNAAFKLRR